MTRRTRGSRVHHGPVTGRRAGGRDGVLAALLLGIAASGSAGACAVGSDPAPELARNEVLARTLVAAREAGDPDALGDLFRPDAVYHDFSNAVEYQGTPEIVGYLMEIHGWASDVVLDVTAVHPSAGGAVVEWVFSAVQTDPIPGRVEVATGREVVLNGVTILEIEGGLVARGADYVDALPLVLQLGGKVEMPGGSAIELGRG